MQNNIIGKTKKKFIIPIFIVLSSYISSAQIIQESKQKYLVIKKEEGKTLYNCLRSDQKGHEIFMPFKTDLSLVTDVKQLSRRCTDIIIGRPLSQKQILDKDGNEINTFHLFQVQSVIKGNIKNGGLLKLREPGGTWQFSDNTIIHNYQTYTRRLHNNSSFVIFIKKEKSKDIHWIPAQGIQCIFEIDADTHSIIPFDLVKDHPIVVKYENIAFGEFVAEIISAVAVENN